MDVETSQAGGWYQSLQFVAKTGTLCENGEILQVNQAARGMRPNLSFIRYSTLVTRDRFSARTIKSIICGIVLTMAVVALLPSFASGNKTRRQGSEMDGAKIFADNCVECHAADGHGLMLHQPNFKDPSWQRTVTDEELSKVIKWGREPMPFWVGALNDAQIAAVVRFIRSLGGAGADDDRLAPAAIGPRIAEASRNQKDSQATTSTEDNCSACHQKQDQKILSLYSQSVHAKAGKSCNSCHGGDASATAKQEAHSLNFAGKPSSDQAVRMCGTCHRSEAAQYRASHHFPTQKNVSRVDCVECHGAHTVGAPSRGFSVAYFCSGCHGLEYLPGLQQQFQDMLNLSDDLRLALQDITESGRAPSEDILQRRKEIQRLTAEIVHKTDLEGGTAKIPHILELGEKLKSIIRSSTTH